MIEPIELWFDFSCPYAYLASWRAPDLAHRLGVPLAWKPMLLGGVFRGIGAGDGPMATLSPVRAAYNLRDMHRWAEQFHAPFAMPAAHPMRTVLALRTLLGLPEERWSQAIPAIFAAYWARGEDITSPEVLGKALGEIPEAAAAIAGADQQERKDELRRRTDEAISLGIFGAPAWVIRRPGRQHVLIWGQDRMPWVEAVIGGWDPGEPRDQPAARGAAVASPPLDFYFDVSSPFAYLGLTQLYKLHAAPRLRPIFLGGLFRSIGTPDVPLFAVSAAKRAYVTAEMYRWANWFDVSFHMPSKFPQRTLTVQRILTIAPPEKLMPLAYGFMSAIWVDDEDVEDDAVVMRVLERNGAPELLALAPTGREKLLAETNAAAERGIFGLPAYVVGGDDGPMVWGQDRTDQVALMLAGWKPVHG